jgi:hypothetical protein
VLDLDARGGFADRDEPDRDLGRRADESGSGTVPHHLGAVSIAALAS